MTKVIILIFSFSVCGCSAISSKMEPRSQIGKPFSGIRDSSKLAVNFGHCMAEGFPLGFIGLVPFVIIDFSFSLVADIVFLPVDVIADKPQLENEDGSPCSGH